MPSLQTPIHSQNPTSETAKLADSKGKPKFFQLAQNLGQDKAKVSWVRENGQHAILLIELFQEGEHKIYKAHFRGDHVITVPFRWIRDFQPFWGLHYRNGRAELKDLTGKKINFEEVLQSWELEPNKAQALLDYVQSQLERKDLNFNILGDGALSSMFMASFFNQHSHSCVTWSRQALLHAGIHIPKEMTVNGVTITSRFAKTTQAVPMNAKAMAYLARDDYNQAINNYFPQPFENEKVSFSNTLVHHVTRGPVEFVLGQYSPFMLTCAYGHDKTLSQLVTSYNGNPYINVKAKLCWGLLGRYSGFDCANSWLFRPYVAGEKRQAVQEYLAGINHNETMQQALTHYIETREQNQDEYKNHLSFFGRKIIDFGCDKQSKIQAAQTLKQAIADLNEDDNELVIDMQYKYALSQGELGKMLKDYLKYNSDVTVKYEKPEMALAV